MKALEKANYIYGKYLFILIPAVTISMMIWELFANIGNEMGIIANIILGITSILFAYLYIKGGKRNITFFLIQIMEFYYTVFLFISRRIVIKDIYGVIFVCIGIFLLFFILGFNKKHKNN